MQPGERIFVAGSRGLVGSALMRRLAAGGYGPVLSRSRHELDLSDPTATRRFFEAERPRHVFLAAARVGGIHANATEPADFIHANLAIQTSVLGAAHATSVGRLLFLGSSCIYPRLAEQPIREEALLTGPLEPSNRAYAVAKIAGIETCRAFNAQHGTRYLAVMPSNLYGPGDNYHPTASHVIPALLRRFHEARRRGEPTVSVWGTGTPRREFVYSDDLADACVHLMALPGPEFDALLADPEAPALVNIGAGSDVSIAELAQAVAEVVDYPGRITYDPSRPDGTPRKLLDVHRIAATGWQPRTPLARGLRLAYRDFVERNPGA